MSLDLRNFVQVNINYHSSRVSSVERGIVTLITTSADYVSNPFAGKIFWSYSDYEEAKATASPVITSTDLDPYVASFFSNKGKGLQIIGGYNSAGTQTLQEFLLAKIKELDYRFVIITSDADYDDLLAVAKMSATTNTVYNAITDKSTVSTFDGINEKFFISSTDTNTPESLSISDGDRLSNFVLKYGRKGIEMLPAAYLSSINFRAQNGISDYNFTIETLKGVNFDFQSAKDGSTITEDPTDGSLISDNDTGVHLMDEFVNFDTILVNNIRNLSGDTLKGEEVVNYYTKIILTQTLTERILTLLVSKLKYNQTSINRVMNAITQELNNYVTNGYLQPGYIWTKDPLNYNYNGVDYQVCARNEVLQKGYKSIILPITALTEEERNEHVFPPVYVLLADQRAIRMIVITGDIY